MSFTLATLKTAVKDYLVDSSINDLDTCAAGCALSLSFGLIATVVGAAAVFLQRNYAIGEAPAEAPSVQPPSPIHALHAKVFSNYVKWCRAMGVRPHFSKMNTSMSAPPAVASRVVDLVLYFCIWGEGCNLRHMAECVWFLYHKMMEELTLRGT